MDTSVDLEIKQLYLLFKRQLWRNNNAW